MADQGNRAQNFAALWYLPCQPNPLFTGRDRIIKDLRNALTIHRIAALTQSQVIGGFGGIGKTQTAIEYAHRYRNHYNALFWVNADSETTLNLTFAEMAKLLDLPEKDQFLDDAIRAVKDWLEKNTGWLLIFDNADRPGILKPFRPLNREGHVLLTTRA